MTSYPLYESDSDDVDSFFGEKKERQHMKGLDPNEAIFGCKACQRHWIAKVRKKKKVSRCKKCNTKLDPLAERSGYLFRGKGLFQCECGHHWTNGNACLIVRQPCFKCGKKCRPVRIYKGEGRQGPRLTGYRHQCEDCPNCQYWKNMKKRKEENLWSYLHASTGSTISAGTNRNDEVYFALDGISHLPGENNRAPRRKNQRKKKKKKRSESTPSED